MRGPSRKPGSTPERGAFRHLPGGVDVRLDGRLRVPRERNGSFRGPQGHGNASGKPKRLQARESQSRRPVTQVRLGFARKGGMAAPSGKPGGVQAGLRNLAPGTRTGLGERTCPGSMTNAPSRGGGRREAAVVGSVRGLAAEGDRQHEGSRCGRTARAGGRDESPKGSVVAGSSARRMRRKVFLGPKGFREPRSSASRWVANSSRQSVRVQRKVRGQTRSAKAKPGSVAREKVPNPRPARESGRRGGREPSWRRWERFRSGVAPCQRPARVGGVGTVE